MDDFGCKFKETNVCKNCRKGFYFENDECSPIIEQYPVLNQFTDETDDRVLSTDNCDLRFLSPTSTSFRQCSSCKHNYYFDNYKCEKCPENCVYCHKINETSDGLLLNCDLCAGGFKMILHYYDDREEVVHSCELINENQAGLEEAKSTSKIARTILTIFLLLFAFYQ